jgi:DNA-binding NarL/FixJ family response regulator
MDTKKIIIADDHSIVRRGVVMLLKRLGIKQEVVETSTFEGVLEICKHVDPELIVLDINLPGGNSSKMISDILEHRPHSKILVFTSYEEDVYAEAFLQLGALGYVNKLSSEEDIEAAIQTTLASKTYISDAFAQKLKERRPGQSTNLIKSLSERELEIGRLMAEGKGNLDITQKLGLKASTISTYKQRIFFKLNVGNIADLIAVFKKYDVS